MSDFCYARPMLERIFRQAELMDCVMQRVGIDPATAARLDHGTAWYEARTRCISCCNERQCRAWLACADPPTALPPSCADVEFFRRCAMRRPSKIYSPSLSPAIVGGTP